MTIPCVVCGADSPTINLVRVVSAINNDDMDYSYTVTGPGPGNKTKTATKRKWVYSYRGWCSYCETEMVISTTKNYGPEGSILCPFCTDFPETVDLMKIGREKYNHDKLYTVSVKGPGARKKAESPTNNHEK